MITEKHYPVLLVVLSSILFFFALGFRDFWAPVEPRYAEIVRVMFAKGEWIVPTVNGGVAATTRCPTSLLPASLLLTVGGALAAVYLVRRELGNAMVAIVAWMALSVVTAAFWVFPYLEAFKSPRPFAREIAKLVPATVPLYIYADTMHDFNYYAERDAIPVLAATAAVEKLLATAQSGFLSISERDFAKLPMLPRAWVIASGGKGRMPWHLVQFKR